MSRVEPITHGATGMPPLAAGFLDGTKSREEAKRAAFQDPLVKWRTAQEFLRWAASQATAPQATPSARKAKERCLLAGMGALIESAGQPGKADVHDA